MHDKEDNYVHRDAISEISDFHLNKFGCNDLPKNHTFNDDIPGPIRANPKNSNFKEKKN